MEQDGRQAACPGEVVTFTCEVAEGIGLQWIAEPFIPRNNPGTVVFLIDAVNGTTDNPTAEIHVVLDAVSPTSNPRLGDFISTLTVNDPGAVEGVVIQCNAADPIFTASKTLITGSKLCCLFL